MRYHQVWDPDQQLEAIKDPSLLTGKPPVVITIDDGYRDFLDVAFPLLKARSLPATLFVTTGFIDGRLWFWWDRLAYLLAGAPPGNLTLEFLDRRISFDSSDPHQTNRAWNTIADYLSIQPDHLKEKVISDLASACGFSLPQSPPIDFAPLNWEQIMTMAQSGISIGAHTLTHRVLSRVDPAHSWEEIMGSRNELEKMLDKKVGWFCYPQGGPDDYLPETADQV
ncbi:MAG: hypothetical protein DRI24_19200, partial [Deltaproteobacteria bacterium]